MPLAVNCAHKRSCALEAVERDINLEVRGDIEAFAVAVVPHHQQVVEYK